MVPCSSVKSPWLQGQTTQLFILARRIFLEQVSHFLLCSFCSFLSVWMFLLLSDPWLLSSSAYAPLVNLETFWDQQQCPQWIQYMDHEFPGSCPVHAPHFSPLAGDCSKREEPLDKTYHLFSGVVVQLVAWEPDCVSFSLFPMEREQRSNRRLTWKLSQPSCSSLQPERLASAAFSGPAQTWPNQL